MTEQELSKFKQARNYLTVVTELDKYTALTVEELRLKSKALQVCVDLFPKVRLQIPEPPTDLFDT